MNRQELPQILPQDTDEEEIVFRLIAAKKPVMGVRYDNRDVKIVSDYRKRHRKKPVFTKNTGFFLAFWKGLMPWGDFGPYASK